MNFDKFCFKQKLFTTVNQFENESKVLQYLSFPGSSSEEESVPLEKGVKRKHNFDLPIDKKQKINSVNKARIHVGNKNINKKFNVSSKICCKSHGKTEKKEESLSSFDQILEKLKKDFANSNKTSNKLPEQCTTQTKITRYFGESKNTPAVPPKKARADKLKNIDKIEMRTIFKPQKIENWNENKENINSSNEKTTFKDIIRRLELENNKNENCTSHQQFNNSSLDTTKYNIQMGNKVHLNNTFGNNSSISEKRQDLDCSRDSRSHIFSILKKLESNATLNTQVTIYGKNKMSPVKIRPNEEPDFKQIKNDVVSIQRPLFEIANPKVICTDGMAECKTQMYENVSKKIFIDENENSSESFDFGDISEECSQDHRKEYSEDTNIKICSKKNTGNENCFKKGSDSSEKPIRDNLEKILKPKKETNSPKKSTLSPNTENLFKEKLKKIYSQIISVDDNYCNKNSNIITKNDVNNVKQTENCIELKISDMPETKSISKEIQKTSNETILSVPEKNAKQTKKSVKSSQSVSQVKHESPRLNLLQTQSIPKESSLSNNNFYFSFDTDKIINPINKEIEESSDIKIKETEYTKFVRKKSVLSEDFLNSRYSNQIECELLKEQSDEHKINSQIISQTQSRSEYSENMFENDKMLKIISEEITKFNSQPKEITNESIYGIKDFVKSLPKLSKIQKPYIKRYRKGDMRIYRVNKLKKNKPVEECKNLENVMEKMSQSYYGNIKRNPSAASVTSNSTNASYVTDVTRSEILSDGLPDLSAWEQLIRKGIHKLSKDKELLYTENREMQIKYNKLEIRKVIQGILVKVVEDFAKNKPPYFSFRTHSLTNCISQDGILQLKPFYESQFTKVSYGNSHSRFRFNLMLFMLNKIKCLLDNNTKLTKREIYYQLKPMIPTQGYIDRAVHGVSSLLQVSPHSMNIIAQKGLVFGNLTIQLSSGETINCNIPGTLIPQDIDDIVEIQSRAYFILVVEKESIFHKLLEEDLPNRLTRPFIMITGKGFPDLNTQLFLRKLWMVMSIPVFIFVDADPDGINIMLTYRFGSISNAHISHILTVPKAKWLGVFPSEIEQFDLDHQVLNQKEIAKVKQLLKLPYMKEQPEIVEQLKILLKRNYKTSIEGLIKTDTYLSNIYLPNKFYSAEFI